MIRKSIIILACGLVLNTASASENYYSVAFNSSAPAGFTGPDARGEISVKDLLKQANDDTKVVLKGHIIKRVSHDKYVFTDGTAEVVVEIDSKRMPAEQITPTTLVKLYGEVDKNYIPAKIEIDVKVVEIQK